MATQLEALQACWARQEDESRNKHASITRLEAQVSYSHALVRSKGDVERKYAAGGRTADGHTMCTYTCKRFLLTGIRAFPHCPERLVGGVLTGKELEAGASAATEGAGCSSRKGGGATNADS